MSEPPDLDSPAARELLDRLAGEQIDPGRALALAQSLRASYPPGLVAAALTQQALRQAARAKFGRAGQMLFTRDGLEQASSDATARHGAARFAGAGRIADLCCGIGASLAALARVASEPVIAVDRDLTSLRYARHNAAVHGGAGVAVVCADVRDLAVGGVDAVFIDPARRAGSAAGTAARDGGRGGRRLLGGRSEPPLEWCVQLADRIGRAGIKTAPGLDRALIPAGWEAEFVAVGRELKEALLWSPALATTPRRATVLAPPAADGPPGPEPAGDPPGPEPAGDPAGRMAAAGPARPGRAVHTLTGAGDGPEGAGDVPVAAPGEFLLDPNPAVTRAGLVGELARRTGGWQIDPMIAFLSSGRPFGTPFGRGLRVLHSAPWQEKAFARRLRELGIGSADIRRRGLAGDVTLIHRRLGLRGPGSAVLVLTRVSGRPWGLICTAEEAGHGSRPRIS